jgi:predicted ATPase/DNA-binding winged helix-turn-helix (wHTH) protein
MTQDDAPPSGPAALRFGSIEVRPAQRQLLIHGKAAPLGSRAFDLLLLLIEGRDRALPKQELLRAVWPDTVVEENNLAVQIGNLRKLLGAQAISTVPGRGYRFTIEPTGAPQDGALPPPRPAPASQPSLIGREMDLAALARLLPAHRLITLVGSGGIGKTRLARQLIADRRSLYAHGVGWVELAGLRDGGHVPAAIARALGLELAPGDPLASLTSALRPLTLLLALDNAEHLDEAVARTVDALLSQAVGVRIVVTSQVPLGLAAEQVFRLEPLDLPPPGATPEEAIGHGAVDLFVQRARAAEPRFALDARNVAAVIDICRRLNGIALAEEMAAARLPLLGVHGLAAALDEQLDLLRAKLRDVPPRQQTLRATLEWSHGLLSAPEQSVLRRLAVFAGGFTLEMAIEVAADADADAERWGLIDTLGVLVDRSLVMVDAGDPPRYRLLESTRAFALEQLAAFGEQDARRARHARTIRGHLWKCFETRFSAFDPAIASLEREVDNAREAMSWALRHDPETAVALAYPLAAVVRQVTNERAIWDATEPLIGDAIPIRLRAEWATGACAMVMMNSPYKRWAEVAVRLWREIGDTDGLMSALIPFVRADAEPPSAERLAAIRQLQVLNRDPHRPAGLRARGLLAEARAALLDGDHDRTQALLQGALHLSESASDSFVANAALLCLADNEMAAGRVEDAVAHSTHLAERLRSTRLTRLLGVVLINLCGGHLFLGSAPKARAVAVQAWPLACAFGYQMVLCDYLPLLAALEGRAEAAAQLLGCTDARLAILGFERQANEHRAVEQARRIACDRLGRAEFERLQALGAGLDDAEVEAMAFGTGGPHPANRAGDVRGGDDPLRCAGR